MKEEKKIIKKRKLKLKKVLVFFLILYIIVYLLIYNFNIPIKNIYIHNNSYLKDQEIIDLANISNYPSLLFTTNRHIKKSILKDEIIKNVTIKKSLKGRIDIYVEEYKPLFYSSIKNETVLENGNYITKNFNVPVLNNNVDEDTFDKLVEKMNELEEKILLKISEIEYKPNDIDKERILLTMTDGNYVYLTLYKFEKISEYNEILPSLEGKRGILYLDSGNYFEIIE